MSLKLLIIFSVLLLAAQAVKPRVGFNVQLSGPNRIIGGIDATKDEFPHQALLEWNSNQLIYACGGTIIDSQWILTAGHCVPDPGYNSFVIKAGKHHRNIDDPTEQIIDVDAFYVHENYVGGVAPNDIALLKLRSPLKLNKSVNVINLPKRGSKPAGNSTLSGWGSNGSNTPPSILQKVDLPIIDFGTCKSALESLLGETAIHVTNVCTGPLSGGVSACPGDSGGPLIAKNATGAYEVIGLSSWVILPCGIKGGPSVYTEVAFFIDWIYSTMKNH